jgi:hypothetical protein
VYRIELLGKPGSDYVLFVGDRKIFLEQGQPRELGEKAADRCKRINQNLGYEMFRVVPIYREPTYDPANPPNPRPEQGVLF